MEKEVLVLMLLSVFSLMSLALSPTTNYILERQMLDACGIQAIANISRMQWQSSKDHVLRGYDFAYDGLNRLEESTYAEGADMSQNKSSFDNNQNPTFHYYEKDHLGSIRMVVNENGTIEQVNHYYPFGGVYGDLSYNSETQRNKYIGKEFDHMHGLDWYDHGARMYDAAKVSWDRVDRLGEKYTQLSPYLYCGNNSLVNVDADGKRVKTIYFKDKEDPQWYRSSKSFYLAMMQFAQTDFGKQILSDFTPKGSYFFGVKGNGKYSKYDLELQEINITEPQKKTAYWRDINAQTQLLETDQGKPRFVVIFDVDRPTNELTKTIAHELAGHLYNYESVLKLYEDIKDFQKANFEFFKKSSKQEHLEMENKKYEKVNLYQQVMNQIEQFFKHK